MTTLHTAEQLLICFSILYHIYLTALPKYKSRRLLYLE